MKKFNYNEMSQSNNKVVLNDAYKTTFLMGKNPIYTHDNGVNVFKVLVVVVMRNKRVLYDRYTVTDAQNPYMIINGKTVVNPAYKAN